jgi:hypothetical protein
MQVNFGHKYEVTFENDSLDIILSELQLKFDNNNLLVEVFLWSKNYSASFSPKGELQFRETGVRAITLTKESEEKVLKQLKFIITLEFGENPNLWFKSIPESDS